VPDSRTGQFVPTGEQLQAIEHVLGPMLVVAGAGTGKTTVLVRRIARLIETGAAKPDEILAVTYTRNAAAELITRVGQLLYPNHPNAAAKLLSTGLQATTFHAYCYTLLCGAHAEFDLIDDKDLFVLLRRRVADLNLKYFIKAASPGKFLLDLLDFFRRCHDELRTPKDYATYVAQIECAGIPLPRVAKSKDAETMAGEEVLGRCAEIARTFSLVERWLQTERLGTYGHIISRAVDLLAHDEDTLHLARRRARFILVDEFQDSNVAQIQLTKLLASEQSNVFAVGDPDQAIFRFRGATAGAFDQFLRIFGVDRVKRVMMSENRRSTQPILRCAYQAISHNPQITSTELNDSGWKRQPLIPARLAREPQLVGAPPVRVILHNGNEHEADFVADTIEAVRRKRPKTGFGQFAVLYHQHAYRDQILAELRRRGIPCHVKGVDLLCTPELRDAIAVLRALNGPDPVALFRVAALPQFRIDPERFRAELALADRGTSIELMLQSMPGGKEVMATLRGARQDLTRSEGKLSAAFEIAQRAFRLPQSKPVHRLKEFCDTWCTKPWQISGAGTLGEFLEYLDFFREANGALSEDRDDEDPVTALGPRDLTVRAKPDAVQLMTIHSAKGLEFPYVFLLRVVSQSFPANYRESLVEFPQELRNPDNKSDDDSKTLHAEEQRRLLYVAMTRAMDKLVLLGKVARFKDPVPAKYLQELARESKSVLAGALECEIPQAPLLTLPAAAEHLEPAVAQWVQLPPRAETKLCDLSASAIDQYERCPMAFKLSRDWRIPEEPAAAMQYGAAMHTALKAYFDGVRAGRPPDTQSVIACFMDEFGKAKIEEDLQRGLFEDKARAELTRLLDSNLARPPGKILDTERRFKVQIGKANVTGRMDRLDALTEGEVSIVDYKTGNPKSQDDADKSLQLSVYALAAQRIGMRPGPLVFINLENGTAVESRRTTEDLVKAENKVSEVAGKIAAGEFDPRPGFWCRTCSYHSICPAQEVAVPSPLSPTAPTVN